VSADGSLATTLTKLACALVDVEPVSTGLGSRPRIAARQAVAARPAELAAAQVIIDRLAGELSVPAPQVVASHSDLAAAELAIGNRLCLTGLFERLELLRQVRDAQFAAAVSHVRAGLPAAVTAAAGDGSPLRCYATGHPCGPVVALVPTCGMPIGLLRPWISGLGDRFRVLTWESRGLFPVGGALDEDFDQRRSDIAAQAGDLLAVLDAFGVSEAHVVGLCGGAAVALACDLSRVLSLSLWHGDFELGSDAPKTSHQQDTQSLMVMAGRHRQRAAGLHVMLSRPRTLQRMRAELAHHLIYPYASPELLYRYGRLNGAIMTTDCRPLLTKIDVPTLVASSMADTTAHPAGSVAIAARIPAARLELLPGSDHLSAFDPSPEVIGLARTFLDQAAGMTR